MIPSRSKIFLRFSVLLYDVISRLLLTFDFVFHCDGFFFSHEKNKLMGELVKCTETKHRQRTQNGHVGEGRKSCKSAKPGAKQIRFEPWRKQTRGKGSWYIGLEYVDLIRI